MAVRLVNRGDRAEDPLVCLVGLSDWTGIVRDPKRQCHVT